MRKTKMLWALLLALIAGIVMPASLNAQSKSLPANLYFVGTVSYDFGMGRAKTVKCFLDLSLSKGQVSGYTNYGADFDGMASQVVGTVKAKSNGTYYLDVYVTDNSGCDWEGIYNPKTGVFSGQFSGRGMSKTYPFKFVRSTK